MAVGQFAVIDGVVVMTYEDEALRWLRAGGRLLAWSDAWLSMDEGLSAQELVIETGDETIRLRADGDPVAGLVCHRAGGAFHDRARAAGGHR